MSVKRLVQCVLLFLLCFSAMGNPQLRDTALQGQVVDASGAGVPGARLLIVNLNTLEEQRAVVKPDGKFTISSRTPGTPAPEACRERGCLSSTSTHSKNREL